MDETERLDRVEERLHAKASWERVDDLLHRVESLEQQAAVAQASREWRRWVAPVMLSAVNLSLYAIWFAHSIH